MKKLWKTATYKRFQKKHSRRQLKSKLRFKNYRLLRNTYLGEHPEIYEQRRKKNTRDESSYQHIVAPEHFSFVENTEQVVLFINKLDECFRSRVPVFVVLSKVKRISYDAIVVLLSLMVKFKSAGMSFNGDFPEDHAARSILEQSGFISRLYQRIDPRDIYNMPGKPKGGIHTHARKFVDSSLSARIISEASETIWGTRMRCQGVQRALLELMQNTQNHADIYKRGEKHWWLSTHHLPQKHRVCFSFIDFGVGIFTSLENKVSGTKFHGWRGIFSRIFGDRSNADYLQLILAGELHKTVLKRSYRGKGLPGIQDVLKRNQISNLHIITNNVFADVSRSKYSDMKESFNGTFVYWELNKSNERCTAV